MAGNIDWEPLRDQVGRLFGDWQAASRRAAVTPARRRPASTTLPKETTQTQIGIAYPSVPIGHPDYYAALGAVNVLSGGMSSRLFTEVREKRGLCYAVWASYQTFKDRASVICYAGTTTERAQETLDVTLRELQRLQRRHRGGGGRARAGRAEVVAHHAGGIDLGAGRRRWPRTGTTWAGCAASTRSRRPSTA